VSPSNCRARRPRYPRRRAHPETESGRRAGIRNSRQRSLEAAKLQCFAARAERLRRTEQARILRLLIERIDVAPDGISVMLHAAGIRSLVAELAGQEAPALAASEPLLEAAE